MVPFSKFILTAFLAHQLYMFASRKLSHWWRVGRLGGSGALAERGEDDELQV